MNLREVYWADIDGDQVVICPCLFRRPNPSMTSVIDSAKAAASIADLKLITHDHIRSSAIGEADAMSAHHCSDIDGRIILQNPNNPTNACAGRRGHISLKRSRYYSSEAMIRERDLCDISYIRLSSRPGHNFHSFQKLLDNLIIGRRFISYGILFALLCLVYLHRVAVILDIAFFHQLLDCGIIVSTINLGIWSVRISGFGGLSYILTDDNRKAIRIH